MLVGCLGHIKGLYLNCQLNSQLYSALVDTGVCHFIGGTWHPSGHHWGSQGELPCHCYLQPKGLLHHCHQPGGLCIAAACLRVCHINAASASLPPRGDPQYHQRVFHLTTTIYRESMPSLRSQPLRPWPRQLGQPPPEQAQHPHQLSQHLRDCVGSGEAVFLFPLFHEPLPLPRLVVVLGATVS